ncbi:hypothetical protein BH10BAC4_BH10BAC4_12010 [soil metagenome]
MTRQTLLSITVLSLISFNCSIRSEKASGNTAIPSDSVPAFHQGEQNFLELETYIDSGIVLSDTATFQVIDHTCAISVFPNNQQIEKMRQLYGEDNFSSIVDDAMWYTASTNEILDSMKIERDDITKQFVIFKDEKKTWTLNIRKKGMPEWNLFFFKKGKAPEVISTADLTPEKVKEYFY